MLAVLAKSIAIAIAILVGKSVAILTGILFAIVHYLLPQINFDFCCCVQLLRNFRLTTDYMIMWSTKNLSDKQVVFTCYFLFSPFHIIEQKNEKFFGIIKQHSHD